jgi:hypothetical protein
MSLTHDETDVQLMLLDEAMSRPLQTHTRSLSRLELYAVGFNFWTFNCVAFRSLIENSEFTLVRGAQPG